MGTLHNHFFPSGWITTARYEVITCFVYHNGLLFKMNKQKQTVSCFSGNTSYTPSSEQIGTVIC